jgi:PST family polysaccharide transporter
MSSAPTHAVRATRGASVLVSTQFLVLGCQLGGDILLAHLLLPADFGLVTMVLAITNFAMVFKDFGLSAAGIQTPNLTNAQASNLFWCNVGLSGLLTLLLLAAAPVIQWAYAKPHLAEITAGLSFTFLLAGLGAQHQAQLTRQTRFAATSRAQILGVVAGYAAAALAAKAGMHHGALVLLQLVRQATQTLALFVSLPWIPAWPARRQGTGKLLRFGSAMAGFDAINYFSRNADKLVIGRLFGEVVLGHYGRAYQFLLLPIAQIRGPISGAGMPLLSALQDRPAEYRKLYLGMVNAIASVALPTLCWLAVESTDLTRGIFGEKWMPSAGYFQLLAVAGLVQPTVGLLGLLLTTLGRGGRYFQWGCWHSGAMVLSFFVGIPWGVPGITLSYAAANFIAAPLSAWFCTQDTPVSFRDFCQVHTVPAAFALGAGALTAVAAAQLSHWDLWSRLIVSSLLFAALYLTQFALFRHRLDEVRWLVNSLLRRQSPPHALAH